MLPTGRTIYLESQQLPGERIIESLVPIRLCRFRNIQRGPAIRSVFQTSSTCNWQKEIRCAASSRIVVEGCMQAPVLNRSGMTEVVPSNGKRTDAMTRVATTSGSNLEISVAQMGEDATVRLTGRINVDSSPDLRDCLRAILSKEPLPRTVTVD